MIRKLSSSMAVFLVSTSLLAVIVVSPFISTARSGSIDEKIDAYVKGEMEANGIPGLSFAVVKDGKVVKAEGYGFANVETKTKATPETVYKIASVSKQFMATAIMLLQQVGKLTVDDKVSRHIDGTPDSWKDMTIRQLLNHTSGLPENPPGFEPFKITEDSVSVERILKAPLLTPPGEKSAYSNSAYFVVAEIIRKVSGTPWDKLLTDRVFSPLGMSGTRATTTSDIVPNRADGYELKDGVLKNAEHWVALRPSGGCLSTVLDLAKWDVALNSDLILSASSREQMWTPSRLNAGTTIPYGLGWSLSPWEGHKRISHNGSLPGFATVIERFTDDKLTVIVFMNRHGGDAGKIARMIADFYIQKSDVPPKTSRLPSKVRNRDIETVIEIRQDDAKNEKSRGLLPGPSRRLNDLALGSPISSQ